MKQTTISLLTTQRIVTLPTLPVIDEIIAAGERWQPEKFNNVEPLKRPFTSSEGLAQTCASEAGFWTLLVARRKRVRYDLTVFEGHGGRVGTVHLAIDDADVDEATVDRLFTNLCARLMPELAYAHRASDTELQHMFCDPTLKMKRGGFALMHAPDVERGIDRLFWRTFFGTRSLQKITPEKIAAVPGFSSRTVANGTVLCAPHALACPPDSYPAAHEAYLAAMRAIGREHFRNDSLWAAKAFATAENPWIPPKVSPM